jgi:uncharacterized protein
MNAVALLEKYFPDPNSFRIILDHSQMVAVKALQVACNLANPSLDLEFIEESALLHDIGACRTAAPKFHCHGTEPYIRQGIIGKEILDAEGFPLHAPICERHIGVGLTIDDIRSQKLPLPERDMTPLSLEEKIICFSDLFYSKDPGKIGREKSIDKIKKGLGKFGAEKVSVFEDLTNELKYL